MRRLESPRIAFALVFDVVVVVVVVVVAVHVAVVVSVIDVDVDDVVVDAVQVKMVYYAAHDTNLLYLAELLDLKWVSDSLGGSGGKGKAD